MFDEAMSQAWVFGGANRLAISPSDDWLKQEKKHLQYAANAYHELLGRAHYHIPFFMVLDVYMLLSCGVDFDFAHFHFHDDQLQQSFEEYRRVILGKSVHHPLFEEAVEHLDTLQQTQWLTVHFLERFSTYVPKVFEVLPHEFGRFFHEKSLSAQFFICWSAREESLASYEQIFEEMGSNEAAFRHALSHDLSVNFGWKDLIFSDTLLILSKWEALHRRDLQFAFQQLMRCKASLGDIATHQLRPLVESKEIESRFIDENEYPTGGLRGLTNSGSMENLLRTELVYIDEDSEVDLFDLRFVERELLFYLRDDERLQRKRRQLLFCFQMGDSFVYKDPEREYRLGTEAQAIALLFYDALCAVFDADVVKAKFIYISDQVLNEDMKILSVLLEDRQVRNEVDIFHQRSLPLAAELFESAHKPYVIHFVAEKNTSSVTAEEVVLLQIEMGTVSFAEQQGRTHQWIQKLLNTRMVKGAVQQEKIADEENHFYAQD